MESILLLPLFLYSLSLVTASDWVGMLRNMYVMRGAFESDAGGTFNPLPSYQGSLAYSRGVICLNGLGGLQGFRPGT